jgi:2'-5' RNA ligase
MPRLFVALDLPLEIKHSLEPLADGLGDVRWTSPDQQHLTLRYIGEVDNGRANDVAEALAVVPGAPFELELKGIGHFPPRGEPKVIWAGVAKSRELKDLKRRIDKALKQAGVETDPQKYTPHVTLARLRRPPPQAELASYLMRQSLYQSPPFAVGDFHLYSSWLEPEGPDYQREASYRLAPGAEDEDWGA